MKITVVGCSGSMPGPESPASSYLIEAEGFRVVVDLGNGAFGALQRYAHPTSIDAVVISHLHADHCLDLTCYVVSLRYGNGERYRSAGPGDRIPVIGPAGTRDRIETAYDPLARTLALHELFAFTTPADGELGPFAVSYARVNHPVPTSAVRLSHGGKSVVYSADTGESAALVALAKDADLLLCEASFMPDDEYVPGVHLTGRQAGEHAARAGVGRLLLTHVPPWGSPQTAATEATIAYDGTVELATPGAEIVL